MLQKQSKLVIGLGALLFKLVNWIGQQYDYEIFELEARAPILDMLKLGGLNCMLLCTKCTC